MFIRHQVILPVDILSKGLGFFLDDWTSEGTCLLCEWTLLYLIWLSLEVFSPDTVPFHFPSVPDQGGSLRLQFMVGKHFKKASTGSGRIVRGSADPEVEAKVTERIRPILEQDASSMVLGSPLKVEEDPL